jgi:hypothetical protein
MGWDPAAGPAAAEGAAVLAARPPRADLAPDPDLPDDTRLWAALQQASGGTWGGASTTRTPSPRRCSVRAREVRGREVRGYGSRRTWASAT